jgi:hypothetical protein
MSSGRLLGGVAICILGVLLAVPLGLAMGGVGICASGLTVGLVGVAVFMGGMVAGSVAALWRGAWWAGSLSVSAPMCLGLPFATEAARILSILICALATLLVAFVVRYPGPNSLKS